MEAGQANVEIGQGRKEKKEEMRKMKTFKLGDKGSMRQEKRYCNTVRV
jgi:hypothetical protein